MKWILRGPKSLGEKRYVYLAKLEGTKVTVLEFCASRKEALDWATHLYEARDFVKYSKIRLSLVPVRMKQKMIGTVEHTYKCTGQPWHVEIEFPGDLEPPDAGERVEIRRVK